MTEKQLMVPWKGVVYLPIKTENDYLEEFEEDLFVKNYTEFFISCDNIPVDAKPLEMIVVVDEG